MTITTTTPVSRRIAVALYLVVAAGVFWHQRACLESSRATYETKLKQLDAMQSDARRIEVLRTAPRQATDRQLPHDRLAKEIEEACLRAEIPLKQLASLWPDSPMRLQQSDYKKLATRVSFEDLGLRPLVAFVYHLQAIDASLTIDGIHLSAPKHESPVWNAELTVSYLLYAPRGAAASRTASRGLDLPNQQRGFLSHGPSES